MELLLKRYEILSQKIEDEKDAEFTACLMGVLGNSEVTGSKSPDDSNILFIALTALRIQCNCRLLQRGNKQFENNLSQDIRFLFQKIAEYEVEHLFSKQSIADGLFLLESLCPSFINIVASFIPEECNIDYCEIRDVNKMECYLFFSIADYFHKEGYTEERYLTISAFSNLYKTITRNKPDLYRKYVIRLLNEKCTTDNEFVYRICAVQETDFVKNTDIYSGDFYWFQGIAMIELGKMEEALEAFKKCYRIRKIVAGEQDWFTALAGQEYANVCLKLKLCNSQMQDTASAENFLCCFIDNIESHAYGNIPEDDSVAFEGEALFWLLMYKSSSGILHGAEKYLQIYEKICTAYDTNPDTVILKRRLSNNFWGSYFQEEGNYVLAEKYFYDALESDAPEGTRNILSDFAVKSNLLMMYTLQNSVNEIPVIAEELFALIDEDRSGSISVKDIYRVYGIYDSWLNYGYVDFTKEDAESRLNMLADLKKMLEKSDNNLQQNESAIAVFICVDIMLLMNKGYYSKENLDLFYSLITMVERNHETLSLSKMQYVTLYLSMSLVCWEMNREDAGYYADICMKYADKASLPPLMNASVLETVSRIKNMYVQPESTKIYLEKSLDRITDGWHSCIHYANDQRLNDILVTYQLVFAETYSQLRNVTDCHTTYETLMKFKALASLAGRERNLCYRKGPIPLLEQIHHLQNKLAYSAAEALYLNKEKDISRTEQKLRELEAEYTRCTPPLQFTDISLEKMYLKMPDNSVLIDYCFCWSQYDSKAADTVLEPLLDVYIIQKFHGQCSLQKLTIPNGDQIKQSVSELVNILQDESMNIFSFNIMNKEPLLEDLSEQLIKPVECFIDVNDCQNLFIAPDQELCNLPFGILKLSDGTVLDERFPISIMECGRDFLFTEDKTAAENSNRLIIGNPAYEVKERTLFSRKKSILGNTSRSAEINTQTLKPLPFSELEARLVAKRCHNRPFIGTDATKYLLSGESYQSIHIATHGFFDLAQETDALYSSCLAFSGAANWLNNQKTTKAYGNGILTADEISRIPLHKTELVVLSACLSGMNDLIFVKGFHGLVGAFSSAGVKYVISHLWAEADDLQTVILMDSFYYYYVEKQDRPPAALQKAKKRVKNITVGDLRREGWLHAAAGLKDITAEQRSNILELSKHNDNYTPFSSEAYWGGFICCKCN